MTALVGLLHKLWQLALMKWWLQIHVNGALGAFS
jgi:hypothetical protein